MRTIVYKDFKPTVTRVRFMWYFMIPVDWESEDIVFKRVQDFVKQLEAEGKQFCRVQMMDDKVGCLPVGNGSMRVWYMENVP